MVRKQMEAAKKNQITSAFTIATKRGKRCVPRVASWAQDLIDDLREGETVRITMQRAKTRSQQQNDLFHALVEDYAKTQMVDQVYAKALLCVMFGDAMTLPEFAANPPTWWERSVGCVVYDTKYMRRSTTDYTVAEMSALIDKANMAIYDRR